MARCKESMCKGAATWDSGSIPGLGRSPGDGCGNLCLILVWRIPWTEEPGGLQSVSSQESGTTEATQQARTCKLGAEVRVFPIVLTLCSLSMDLYCEIDLFFRVVDYTAAIFLVLVDIENIPKSFTQRSCMLSHFSPV